MEGGPIMINAQAFQGKTPLEVADVFLSQLIRQSINLSINNPDNPRASNNVAHQPRHNRQSPIPLRHPRPEQPRRSLQHAGHIRRSTSTTRHRV